MAMRFSLTTEWPMASNILRICWLWPSKQRDLVPAVLFGLFEVFDLGRSGFETVFEDDATTEFVDGDGSRKALYLDVIDLWDRFRRRDKICKLAVVRENDQALGIVIEASDRMKAAMALDEVDDQLSAFGVGGARKITFWFVEQNVDVFALFRAWY